MNVNSRARLFPDTALAGGVSVHSLLSQRLAVLRRYGILGGDRDSRLSRLATLACEVCDAPVGLVSFLDEASQSFGGTCGTELAGTPMAESICAHAVVEGDFLEIPDTLADPRTRANPLCTGERDAFRYYAGAVLQSPEGIPFGTVCVLDRTPRRLDAKARGLLALLAAQVVDTLEGDVERTQESFVRARMSHRNRQGFQRVRDFLARGEADLALARLDALLGLQALLDGVGERTGLSDVVGALGTALERACLEGAEVSATAPPMELSATQARLLALLVTEIAAAHMRPAENALLLESAELHATREGAAAARLEFHARALAGFEALSEAEGAILADIAAKMRADMEGAVEGGALRYTVVFPLD